MASHSSQRKARPRRRSPRAGRPSNHTFGRTSSARPARRRDPPPCAGEAKSSLSAASRLGSPATTARSSSLDPLAARMRRSRAARGARRVRAGHGVSRAPLNSLERNKVSLAACERSAIRQSTSPPRTEQERSLNWPRPSRTGPSPPCSIHPKISRPRTSALHSRHDAAENGSSRNSAKLATRAPAGALWVHEIKFDGYRMAARIDRGEVQLLTRTGLDWTAKYPATAAALTKLPVRIRLSRRRTLRRSSRRRGSDFSLMQQASDRERRRASSISLFDLLDLDGETIAAMPLIERKSAPCGSRRHAAARHRSSAPMRPATARRSAAPPADTASKASSPSALDRALSPRRPQRLDQNEMPQPTANSSSPAGPTPKGRGPISARFCSPITTTTASLLYAGRVGTGMSGEDARHDLRRASRAARRSQPRRSRVPPPRETRFGSRPRAIARPLGSTRCSSPRSPISPGPTTGCSVTPSLSACATTSPRARCGENGRPDCSAASSSDDLNKSRQSNNQAPPLARSIRPVRRQIREPTRFDGFSIRHPHHHRLNPTAVDRLRARPDGSRSPSHSTIASRRRRR